MMKKLVLSENVNMREAFLAASYMMAIGAERAEEVYEMKSDDNVTDINSELVKELAKDWLSNDMRRVVDLHYFSHVCDPLFETESSPLKIINDIAGLIRHNLSKAQAFN